MKVIIRGIIIETAWISRIEKCVNIDSQLGRFFTDAQIEIYDVFGNQFKIESKFNSKSHDSFDSANETKTLIESEFDNIIKFLDTHSDKPNYPYPNFEE